MNGCSSQTQVNRDGQLQQVARYIATPKFKVNVVSSCTYVTCCMRLQACYVDNLAHMIQITTWHIPPWRVHVAWSGAYTYCKRYTSCARKGPGHMKLCILQLEYFCMRRILSSSVHIHMVTMHKFKTIMMVLIASVRQLTFYPCKLCTKCHSIT